ncbi:ATPase, T2SS/T4P/T4SS family [Amnibacterium sp. CER49]|uniref:CpaF family protein n=1 Tax=Amnibacterium sp. CER49 TaxID=3039161 RepID=UPI00244ACC0A|nr:ATPase, T2SS/T4P/T4SS family [Amnibacterium sp. CER49]MDH2443205.1 ATPase, T2SS/T4P/T4SS family [Amnibacterium sp. CER49]
MSEPFVPVRRAPAPQQALLGSQAVPAPIADEQRRDVAALGPLAPFAAPGVTDLVLDSRGALWADAGRGLAVVDAWVPLPPPEARRLAVALIATGGRHLDDATPFADVRLPGGVRAHAVLPPVSTGGALLSVRLARPRPWRLPDLVDAGMLDDATADRLREAVRRRRNVLITGAAGSGKTSLLAALLAEAPPAERIVTIEDVAELAIDHPHVVGLEARQANADGAGGVDLPRLVREALRMRPDRLVLGECRGAEIAELLAALNTGHDGGAGTVHCASLDGLGARLEALGALAGLPPEALRRQAAAAIHLVVQLGRRDGHRVVEHVGALRLDPARGLEVSAS